MRRFLVALPGRILKLRIALAQFLLSGTDYEVSVSSHIDDIRYMVAHIDTYVKKSGGLNHPRRIKARYKIGRCMEALNTHARELRLEA